jgi:hypothetical protein
MITVFPEVWLGAVKRYVCACGRRCVRKKKFFQTINPYNKNAQGNMKSREEIMVQLRHDRDGWEVAPEKCTHAPVAPRG